MKDTTYTQYLYCDCMYRYAISRKILYTKRRRLAWVKVLHSSVFGVYIIIYINGIPISLRGTFTSKICYNIIDSGVYWGNLERYRDHRRREGRCPAIYPWMKPGLTFFFFFTPMMKCRIYIKVFPLYMTLKGKRFMDYKGLHVRLSCRTSMRRTMCRLLLHNIIRDELLLFFYIPIPTYFLVI